jgi:hypothetical protein
MGSCTSRSRILKCKKNYIDLGELDYLVHGRPKKQKLSEATDIFKSSQTGIAMVETEPHKIILSK